MRKVHIMESKEKIDIVLKGENLLRLWNEGLDAWNQWFEDNPKAELDFTNVRFPEGIKKPLNGFKLPRRKDIKSLYRQDTRGALFAKTINAVNALALYKQGRDVWNKYSRNPEFHDYDVNFEGVNFPDGEVDFGGFLFPKTGDVNFSRANFGEGEVDFSEVNFGEGEVSFSRANFGEGKVSFYKANFGEGKVDFSRANFGEGKVDFYKANFGEGKVDFYKANFGEGEVRFSSANFDEGEVRFSRVNFGKGEVSFSYGQFGKKLNSCSLSFENAKIDSLNFSNVDSKNCNKLNFEGLTCEGRINFSGLITPTVLNLNESEIKRPVLFNDTKIDFLKTNFSDVRNHITNPIIWLRWMTRCAQESKDESRFQRLKKLSKDAEDYDNVLNFFAKEKRSSYLHNLPIYSYKLWIYCFYGFFSNYGKSILTPLISLGVSWVLFSFIYLGYVYDDDESCDNRSTLLICEVVSLSNHLSFGLSQSLETYDSKHCFNHCLVFESAQDFSASKSFPFLSSANTARDSALREMFGNKIETEDPHPQLNEHINIPMAVHDWARAQNVISTILLALFVLGLRNRFRA